jgi:hypothetical protein
MRVFNIILIVMAFTVVIAFLFGCAGRAQPYGEDLWLGVRYIEQQRIQHETQKQTPQSPAVRQRVNHNSPAGR